VITAIDGEATDTLVDYTATLREHAPGDAVTLTVNRAGQGLTIQATVQERK
jgi:S1-C subfamily serine protease